MSAISRQSLTPRQEEALSTVRHLSVTANAGSGKTAVLVERYVRLLVRQEATVDQVVVLTYTDKAAGELRRRIAAALEDARHQKSGPVELLASIREQLPGAFIGTIHSFCARILREYAIEAGVDPNFGVLEGIDQRVGAAAAIRESLGAILQHEASDDLRLRLYSLLREKGRAWVSRTIAMLIEKRDQIGRLTGPDGLYSLEDDEVVRRWQASIAEHVAQVLADPLLSEDLRRVCSDSPGAGDAFSAFRRAATPEERASAFLALTVPMFRKDGKLAAAFAGSGAAARERATEASRVRRRQTAIVPLLDVLLYPARAKQNHLALLSATRALLTVTRQAIERYDQAKLVIARLDYEDLQLRTRSLLLNEQVRSALVRRFRYIMVDEFQDTNFLQYELLLPLVTGFRTGNLFVVGDPRQSIYGFRHADPAVFEAGKKDILQSGSGGSQVVLDESFRPLSDIAAFVNMLFPREDGAGFQPLVCARRNDSPGRVELLLRDGDPSPMTEAEMIAHRIVQMLDQGETVFDSQERPRRAGPGDIAVLIRSRTALPGLEEALVRQAIPYVVTGGVGFFQTQDLLDFYDYFRFLLNPSDSVALAGILRSPFFYVSDAELFEVALERGERELWEFISAADFPGKTYQATVQAAALLREDMDLGLRLPPAELIERIVRETLYVPKLAGDERGRQRLANLEKLRQFARTAASQGFVNLYDFVERLKILVEREENEGEEEIDSPEDAVRVMTVHAAKGLEFPIVILPRLHKRFQYDFELFLDEQLGIGFSLPGEGEEEGTSPIAALLKECSKQKTIEEEKRILYVACTRARDMLVLSGEWEPDRQKIHALNWVLDGLGLDQEPPHGVIERRVTVERLKMAAARMERRTNRYTLRVSVLYPADLSGTKVLPQRESGTSTTRPQMLVDSLEEGKAPEEYTGVMLRSYVLCPNRFFVRHVLGIPPGEEEEESAKFDATVEHLLRRGDRQALLSLAPSEQLAAVLGQADLHVLVPAVMPVMGGILSDTLPLVYQDRDGVWSFLRIVFDGRQWGDHQIIRDSNRFLLEFDALLLQRLKEAPFVKGSLVLAAQPEEPLVLEADRGAVDRIEEEVLKVLHLILDEEYDHRAVPCPVCQVNGT